MERGADAVLAAVVAEEAERDLDADGEYTMPGLATRPVAFEVADVFLTAVADAGVTSDFFATPALLDADTDGLATSGSAPAAAATWKENNAAQSATPRMRQLIGFSPLASAIPWESGFP